MAVKISGTTVIDDSRNLVNIGTLNGKAPLLQKQVVLNQFDALTLFTGVDRWYAPTALTITNITGRLYTPSTNGTVTFVVNKTSGGTTTTTELSFIGGADKVSSDVSISMSQDDYLTVDITSIGDADDTGENLNIIFTYEEV